MLLNIKSSKYATVWSFCFVEIRNHMQKYISSSVDSINPLAWRSPLMTFTLIQMFFDSVPQRSLCKHHTFISPAVQQRSHLFFLLGWQNTSEYETSAPDALAPTLLSTSMNDCREFRNVGTLPISAAVEYWRDGRTASGLNGVSG